MKDATLVHVVWALVLGAVSVVSLPLRSLVGLYVRFEPRYIAIFAASGAGANGFPVAAARDHRSPEVEGAGLRMRSFKHERRGRRRVPACAGTRRWPG